MDLMERIEKVRRERDALREKISSLKTSIKRCSDKKKVEELRKKLEEIIPLYEAKKREFWELVRIWQKERRSKS